MKYILEGRTVGNVPIYAHGPFQTLQAAAAVAAQRAYSSYAVRPETTADKNRSDLIPPDHAFSVYVEIFAANEQDAMRKLLPIASVVGIPKKI